MKSERELFEERFGTPEHWIEFCDIRDKYICKHNPIDHHLLMRNAKWESWQASAQREGYKLVPVEPSEKMYITGVDKRQSGGNTADVYKAMIGASE